MEKFIDKNIYTYIEILRYQFNLTQREKIFLKRR